MKNTQEYIMAQFGPIPMIARGFPEPENIRDEARSPAAGCDKNDTAAGIQRMSEAI
jgi:hypothetical protein